LVYVKDKDNAEEIVQNFFVHFWEKRADLSINSAIKSYFYSSIRNRALNFIRDNCKLSRFDDDFANSYDLNISNEESGFESTELSENINKAIDTLPPKCKEIFLLSRMHNLSYKEISEKLDISTKTVENQISIALKKLHVELKPYYELFLILIIFLYDF
jgi:RNA polymerase sigma-70 factor (ECF subfamily)